MDAGDEVTGRVVRRNSEGKFCTGTLNIATALSAVAIRGLGNDDAFPQFSLRNELPGEETDLLKIGFFDE
jgi:hypothetical protein